MAVSNFAHLARNLSKIRKKSKKKKTRSGNFLNSTMRENFQLPV
jgi:hypothetical protein